MSTEETKALIRRTFEESFNKSIPPRLVSIFGLYRWHSFLAYDSSFTQTSPLIGIYRESFLSFTRKTAILCSSRMMVCSLHGTVVE